jgi:hypothetical protein
VFLSRASNEPVDVVVEPVNREVPMSDPALRDEWDADPLVEQAVGRLREGLGGLAAVDEWGRPLAWRSVVRIAIGPLLGAMRDAQTSLVLADALADGDDEQPAVSLSLVDPLVADAPREVSVAVRSLSPDRPELRPWDDEVVIDPSWVGWPS